MYFFSCNSKSLPLTTSAVEVNASKGAQLLHLDSTSLPSLEEESVRKTNVPKWPPGSHILHAEL